MMGNVCSPTHAHVRDKRQDRKTNCQHHSHGIRIANGIALKSVLQNTDLIRHVLVIIRGPRQVVQPSEAIASTLTMSVTSATHLSNEA
jgi:hypothetical protein